MLNYAFDSKYLMTVSFRRNDPSKYTEGDMWGYFPSAALALCVSNEAFLKNSAVLSGLKARVSWGLTGGQPINA